MEPFSQPVSQPSEGRISRYFRDSASAYYAVLTAIPMLLAYELLLLVGGSPQAPQVRNAGDVWLRELLNALDISQSHAAMVMLLVLVLALVLLRRDGTRVKGAHLAVMAVEAATYGILLGVFKSVYSALSFIIVGSSAAEGVAMSMGSQALALPAGGGVIQAFALSLGAGLFEEFIFRVVLLWGLLQITRPLLPGYLAGAASIGIAAGLFSAAHYVGPMGDPLEFYSFMFRFLAGLWFTCLYYLRGFSITAYSHAFYDILVLIILP